MAKENSTLSIAHQQMATSALYIITNSIPLIGQLIQEGLVDYWSRVKQDRINLFIEGMKEYFESLRGEEVEEEFLRSADFAEFFELVIRKVAETKSDSKHEYFRNILKNNLRTRTISDFSETFLNLIGQLHVQQIEILNNHVELDDRFYKLGDQIQETKRKIDELRQGLREEKELMSKGKANNSSKVEGEIAQLLLWLNQNIDMHDAIKAEWKKFNEDYNYIPEITYNFYIQDLASKCLLVDRSSGRYDGALPYTRTAITEFGKQLLEFIKGKEEIK